MKDVMRSWNPYIERRRKIIRQAIWTLIVAGLLLAVAWLISVTNLTVGI